MALPFVLDRRSAVSLQRQIYDAWRTAILGGRFTPGERVPSTRAFSAEHGVARITATAAYDQLLAEGYFETRRGAGTYISSDLPDDALRPVKGPGAIVRGQSRRRVRLSRYASRLADIHRPAAPANLLDLSRVGPDLARFPFPLWRRLISRQLRRGVPAVLERAADAGGHEPLRAAIAAHLGRTRAVACAPEQVIIVSGSQQGLDLCARLLLEEGDEAAVENPGYAGARQLFAAHGAHLVTLRVTDSGAAIAGLSNRTRVVHVTPSHQFPIGVSMSLARRLELLEWARSHGAVILEDDYDSEYRYSGPPLPAMHSLAEGQGVIYLGTFSNVMFRGLRVGYIVVPRELVRVFTAAKRMADRHTGMLEQAALADFMLEGHLDRHIRRMRRLYKERRDVMLEALSRSFGDAVAVRGDAAGLHMTVRFRRIDDVRARAARSGVHLAGTSPYYASHPVPAECILGFAAIGPRTIREGIRRIAG